MRSFVKVLLLFFMPLALIAISMEALLRHIPNRFKLQHDYISSHGDTVETLILGSSHSQFGIDPAFLDASAFNLSNKSQTLDLDLMLFNQFSDNLSNLKTLVIRLSYTTLFEQLSDGDESWRLKDYEIYLNANASSKFEHLLEILSVSPKKNIHRISNYYVDEVNTVESTALGWGTELNKPRSIRDGRILGQRTAKKHTATNFRHVDENSQILKSIVAQCAKKGIDVIIITMPATRDYQRHLNADQLNMTVKVGRHLEKAYTNCKYYNLMDHHQFTPADFYDADHLNQQGAQKFSTVLNTLLQQ